MTDVVFTVGNDMRADDGAGPLLAALLAENPVPGWEAVDGGAAPENCTHRVRALEPARVLVVDAADMGLAPGTVRVIGEDRVASHFLITTHAIPLNFLIASLRETIPEIAFLGIQPRDTTFLAPMTPEVRKGVEAIHRALRSGAGADCFPPLGAAER